MTIEKVFPSGAWYISDIVDGYLLSRTYYCYTKREAVASFRAERAARRGQLA